MFTRQNQGRAARNLATTRPGHWAARRWQALPLTVAALLAGTVALPQSALGATAGPNAAFTNLTLLNGWGTYPGSATPAVADVSGTVYLKGAISTSSSNTNNVAFVLPPAFRPAKYVNVPVDMCDATSGELNIAPTGVTEVISQGANTNATCFTSLDGVSFALSAKAFTTLKLQPGWTEFDNLFRKAAARVAGGTVHLAGEIKTAGTNPAAFTLPAGFRPSKNVYVMINLCTGSIGGLHIAPSGAVTVHPEGTGNFWMAQCGTSLEGASYALSPTPYTPLALQNGWTNAPFATANAAVRVSSGIVHFMGAISTTGTNADPFILPAGFRPAHDVYIPVDLCDGNNGRLDIQPDGVVAVQPENGDFAQAQCLTSLDGAFFAR
jgi:hypothetical protein